MEVPSLSVSVAMLNLAYAAPVDFLPISPSARLTVCPECVDWPSQVNRKPSPVTWMPITTS